MEITKLELIMQVQTVVTNDRDAWERRNAGKSYYSQALEKDIPFINKDGTGFHEVLQKTLNDVRSLDSARQEIRNARSF